MSDYEEDMRIIEAASLGPWEDCQDATGDKYISGAGHEYIAEIGCPDFKGADDARYIAHFNPSYTKQLVEKAMERDALRAELITRTGELQTMSEEKAALQAMVNELRETLSDINDVASIVVGDEWLNALLRRIPAQSLADRDMQIAEKVRSACINSVEIGGEEADQEIIDRDWRSPAQEAANLSVRYARSSIRNLNISEVISDEGS